MLIDLILTAVGYLLVPFIFWMKANATNQKYTMDTIKKIVIINGICVWVLFRIITLEMNGEATSGVAAIVWSGIAYVLLKKYTLIEETVKVGGEEMNGAEPINLFSDADRKEKQLKTVVVVLAILLAVSFLLNISLYEKVEFFDEYVVFVDDDGSTQYHKYDCTRFDGDYFFAFNEATARVRGYDPCPRCCGD